MPAGYLPLGDFARGPGPAGYDRHVPMTAVRRDGVIPWKHPVDYQLIRYSDGISFWEPKAPDGFRALGHLAREGQAKPALNEIACLPEEFVAEPEVRDLDGGVTEIWSRDASGEAVTVMIAEDTGTLFAVGSRSSGKIRDLRLAALRSPAEALSHRSRAVPAYLPVF